MVKPEKRKIIRILSLLLYVIFLFCVAYGTILVYRGFKFYSYVKNKNTILTGGIIESHPDFGYAPRAGSQGKMLLRIGPGVPLRYDQNRCRIPENGAESEIKRPLILALGCSFTHGDACLAEETYSYLLGEKIQGSSMNAGFCAQGYSQMVLKARKFIPDLKPDYVIVQYSEWLPQRAARVFAPSFFGKRPKPFFFIDEDDGQAKLHKPVFRMTVPRDMLVEYRNSPKGFFNACSFLFRFALPVLIPNDFKVGVFKMKQSLGIVPRPAKDRMKIIDAVFTEIRELCEASGSKMIVCVIGRNENYRAGKKEVDAARQIPGVVFVDAWKVMVDKLPDVTKGSYMKAYGHYRGTPPVLINAHPNPKAHAIIAEEIAKAIADEKSKSSDNQR